MLKSSQHSNDALFKKELLLLVNGFLINNNLKKKVNLARAIIVSTAIRCRHMTLARSNAAVGKSSRTDSAMIAR